MFEYYYLTDLDMICNDLESKQNQIDIEPLLSDTPESEGTIDISHLIDCRDDVFCCEVSPSSKVVAVGTSKGIVKIYDVMDGRHLYTLVDVGVRRSYLPAVSCSWISDERILVGYASGSIKIWNISNQECLQTIEENRTVLQTCVTPSKDAFITSGKDSDIHIYNLSSMHKIQTCNASPSLSLMDGHRTSVFAIKHHPIDTWNFISGGWDDTVQFWDRREKRAIRRIFGPHICGNSIDINHHDNTILTASWRLKNGLQIWDYREGELIKDIVDDQDSRCLYYAAQFLGADCIMAGGTNKNLFKVIDKRAAVDVGLVSKFNVGVFCCDQSHIQRCGESYDARVCFGYSTKLVLSDIKEVDRKAAVDSALLP